MRFSKIKLDVARPNTHVCLLSGRDRDRDVMQLKNGFETEAEGNKLWPTLTKEATSRGYPKTIKLGDTRTLYHG